MRRMSDTDPFIIISEMGAITLIYMFSLFLLVISIVMISLLLRKLMECHVNIHRKKRSIKYYEYSLQAIKLKIEYEKIKKGDVNT